MRADLPRERVDLRLDAAEGQRPQRGRVDPLFAGQVQLADDQPSVAVLPDADMHPLRDGVVGEGDPAALADGELAQHRSRQSTAVEPSYVGPGDQAPWAADVLATLTRRTRRHPSTPTSRWVRCSVAGKYARALSLATISGWSTG